MRALAVWGSVATTLLFAALLLLSGCHGDDWHGSCSSDCGASTLGGE